MRVLPSQILKASPTQPARLGQISFINSLPVVLPITAGKVEIAADVVFAHPSELNQAYAAGKLDLGAMSSFFYLENETLDLMPTLSISSDGPVGSVLLFSKTEPAQLAINTVSVSASSATSVNLLRILLKEEFGLEPDFVVETNPRLDQDGIDAALIIGDQALSLDAGWSSRFHRADLGAWWHEQTGLPMVFGLWAARKSWVEGNQDQFQSISAALEEAASLGLSSLFPIVMDEAKRRCALPDERLRDYFQQELNFQFSKRHAEGLERFAQLCRQHNLLPKL